MKAYHCQPESRNVVDPLTVIHVSVHPEIQIVVGHVENFL